MDTAKRFTAGQKVKLGTFTCLPFMANEKLLIGRCAIWRWIIYSRWTLNSNMSKCKFTLLEAEIVPKINKWSWCRLFYSFRCWFDLVICLCSNANKMFFTRDSLCVISEEFHMVKKKVHLQLPNLRVQMLHFIQNDCVWLVRFCIKYSQTLMAIYSGEITPARCCIQSDDSDSDCIK